MRAKSPRQVSTSHSISAPIPVCSVSSSTCTSSTHSSTSSGAEAPAAATSRHTSTARRLAESRSQRSSSGATSAARSWRPRRKYAAGGPHSRPASSHEPNRAAQHHGVAPAVRFTFEAHRVALDVGVARLDVRQIGERRHPVGQRRTRPRCARCGRRDVRARMPASSRTSGDRIPCSRPAPTRSCSSGRATSTWSVALAASRPMSGCDVQGGVQFEPVRPDRQPLEEPLLVLARAAGRTSRSLRAWCVLAIHRPASTTVEQIEVGRRALRATLDTPSVEARAAASSMARGIPSRRPHRRATSDTSTCPTSAPAASSRSRNSSAAVSVGSERTGTTCSPSMSKRLPAGDDAP